MSHKRTTVGRILDLEKRGLAALKADDYQTFCKLWDERDKLFPRLSSEEWDILTAEVN